MPGGSLAHFSLHLKVSAPPERAETFHILVFSPLPPVQRCQNIFHRVFPESCNRVELWSRCSVMDVLPCCCQLLGHFVALWNPGCSIPFIDELCMMSTIWFTSGCCGHLGAKDGTKYYWTLVMLYWGMSFFFVFCFCIECFSLPLSYFTGRFLSSSLHSQHWDSESHSLKTGIHYEHRIYTG